MRHPTGRPFLYFLAAGALLLIAILLLPVLHRSMATLKGLYLAITFLFIVPFIFVPQLVFQIERRWIEHGALTDALSATRWTSVVLPVSASTALILLWLNLPWILSLQFGPPRPMTEEEAQSAVATIRAWKRDERLWALLAQLAWKWIPNPTVN